MICTELGTGTTYINRHNETGLVVRPNDAEALREAMQRLHDDRALADRLGRAGRQRFERLFSAQALGSRLSELYQRLARAHRTRSH
nr:glycosyltransferase [Halochromatium salexigens]